MSANEQQDSDLDIPYSEHDEVSTLRICSKTSCTTVYTRRRTRVNFGVEAYG